MKRLPNNFIFSFGASARGKSTIFAAMSLFLFKHPTIRFIPNLKTNPEGASLLTTHWIKKLESGRFPPKTRMDEIIRIDTALSKEQEEDYRPIVYLEMSGEDLEKVDVASDKRLGEKWEEYLVRSKILFLVTSVDAAKEDDILFWQFFTWLDILNIKVPIALIVSQWDKLGRSSLSPTEFVSSNMPVTRKELVARVSQNTKVFKFEIGDVEVVNGENTIKKMKLSDCENILKWIWPIIG